MLDIQQVLAHDRPRQRDSRNVREWAREERLEAYSQADGTGYLRHLVFREGRNTGQALVSLVTAAGEKFERDRFIEVLREFPEVRSIHWAVNDTPAEVTNVPSTLLWGEDAIEEELLGLRFRVRPNAFLQTNTQMAERLYELARDYAGLTGGETVYDLYCGIGTIGLSMAAHALTVWGVEVEEESVACALENADLNGISNAAFFAGNVGQALEELRGRAATPDVVVVDPPRAGLAGKALKRVGEAGAPRLVYVSCNPTTLAGDLEAPARGVRLRARPRAARRHVPAHAARRDGRAARTTVTTFLCKACGDAVPRVPTSQPRRAARSARTSGSTSPRTARMDAYDDVVRRIARTSRGAAPPDRHRHEAGFGIGQRALRVESPATGTCRRDCLAAAASEQA